MKNRPLEEAALAWTRVGRDCDCVDDNDAKGGERTERCDCVRVGGSLVTKQRGDNGVSSTAALLVADGDSSSNSRSGISNRPSQTRTSSSSVTTSSGQRDTLEVLPRDLSLSGTTTLTMPTAPASSTSGSSSSVSTSPYLDTFTPTGIQAVAPTYPPTTSSNTNQSSTSLPIKLSLGIGVPLLVALTLLFTILLHRQHRRQTRNHNNNNTHNKNRLPKPDMATKTPITHSMYPRLYRQHSSSYPSNTTSAATSRSTFNMVITPAPGVLRPPPHPPRIPINNPKLNFPHPPPPLAPAVPRRSSARLLSPGPLTSHPPPSPRPTSSIYDNNNNDTNNNNNDFEPLRQSQLGGSGVGDVLAEYMNIDFSPLHLHGPWDPGQLTLSSHGEPHGSDNGDHGGMPQPPEPVARLELRGEAAKRQFLSVNVHHHSPGGVEDDVSPLSSSSSGPSSYLPARMSAMSGLSPAGPVRTQSRPWI